MKPTLTLSEGFGNRENILKRVQSHSPLRPKETCGLYKSKRHTLDTSVIGENPGKVTSLKLHSRRNGKKVLEFCRHVIYETKREQPVWSKVK